MGFESLLRSGYLSTVFSTAWVALSVGNSPLSKRFRLSGRNFEYFYYSK
jgi:hypothetical protein